MFAVEMRSAGFGSDMLLDHGHGKDCANLMLSPKEAKDCLLIKRSVDGEALRWADVPIAVKLCPHSQ